MSSIVADQSFPHLWSRESTTGPLLCRRKAKGNTLNQGNAHAHGVLAGNGEVCRGPVAARSDCGVHAHLKGTPQPGSCAGLWASYDLWRETRNLHNYIKCSDSQQRQAITVVLNRIILAKCNMQAICDQRVAIWDLWFKSCERKKNCKRIIYGAT